jgi:diguanylate cyclase (GGDEF)-like protein
MDDDAADVPVLEALLRIAEAVVLAEDFDDVLGVIAGQARTAVGAAALSISRCESDDAGPRVLVTAGDPHLPTTGRATTVPILRGDQVWGEIRAVADGGRDFTWTDTRLLSAIARHTAVAIGRAELLRTVWSYAMQDPLTGIANRRAIDARFDELDWATTLPAVLLCDLDGFKRINDRDGHPAGDQLLRDVAAVLAQVAGRVDGAVAARLGGDEFCVLLPDATLAAAQVFAIDATRALHEVAGSSVTVCWGAAAVSDTVRTKRDLLAAADAALLHAKRQGPARYSADVPIPEGSRDIDGWDRRLADRGAVGRLAGAVVSAIDERPDMTLPDALEYLARAVAHAVDAAAWAISETSPGGTSLRLLRNVASVHNRDAGLTVLIDFGPPAYELAHYPASDRAIAEGAVFLAAVGLEGSDADEVALLTQLGYQAVLGVGVPAAGCSYLMEFYSHGGHDDLAAIAPQVQVLAAYCASRLTGHRGT